MTPDEHLEWATRQAEEVRAQVVGEPLIIGRERINLSISIGLCLVVCDGPEDDEKLASSLLRMVDDALFRAKTRGRNHVEALRFIHQSEMQDPPTEGSSPR